ncbi:hypothetical protein BXZ70DRAFT_959912 [Cristinia sonorae]|uniref:DUF6533 domain-containing protein n=1 Tax=Cristinia sonorae TaxID=1940300 RepID=A0A8K0XKX8_9AGAR|nr:hypothetical protein BXZ70DRAFT_959912 [Cristinia sonorae]
MDAQVFAVSATEALWLTRDVSRSEIAAVTVLTYDILISLADEVELVWKRQWTIAKVMYLVARYIPWFFELALIAINAGGTTGLFYTPTDCKRWLAVQAVILQLVITTVDVVLLLRVSALYDRNIKLMAVLSLLFCGEVAYLCYVLSVVTPLLKLNAHCFVTGSPVIFINFWIVSLIFETLLFLLTLWKFLRAAWDGWGSRPVMQQFVTDGTWAYTLVFVVMLINSMFYKFVHSPLAGICFNWLLTTLSFAGSRLILNPRKRSNEGTRPMSSVPIELDDVPGVPGGYSMRGPPRTSNSGKWVPMGQRFSDDRVRLPTTTVVTIQSQDENWRLGGGR